MRVGPGRAIDGARTIQVDFEGVTFEAKRGDTLASALMASGRLAIGKDAVSGRFRGLRALCRPSELPVRVKGRSGIFNPGWLWLEDGMSIHLAGKSSLAPRSTGREDAPDVLVIGAGPAGMIAAETAAGGGASVVLVDRACALGGSLRWSGETLGRMSADAWCTAQGERMRAVGVEIVLETEVLPAAGDAWDLLRLRDATVRSVRPKQTILATGAVARMPVFSGNDLPGVMTAAAMRRALAEWGVVPGSRIAILSATNEGRLTAGALRASGVEVAALVDVRDVPANSDWPVYPRSRVRAAEGTDRIEAIEIEGPGGRVRVECDGLAVAAGWSPQIAPLLGKVRPIWNPAISAWLIPPGTPNGVHPAGAAGGTYSTRGALKSGFFRARRALMALNRVAPVVSLAPADDSDDHAAVFWYAPGPGPAFADFARGVTLDDISKGVAADEVGVMAGRYVADPRLT